MNKIIQVLGPTGVGKSKVAVKLADRIGGEIISADSMQVYVDFNIGTDKLSESDRENIPHHLVDILSDGSQFNSSMFLEKSFEISENMIKQGKLPIVCGGTAMYLSTMIRGIFPEQESKRVSRETLNRIVARFGLDRLWRKLSEVDPVYAQKIGKNDRIRIVRAMEIFYNNRMPPSEIFRNTQTPFFRYEFIRIGLNLERSKLYRQIEKRVDSMIERGLLDEVIRLRHRYPPNCAPFKSLGYKEVIQYLEGIIGSWEETVNLIKQHTRNYAKRQLSWFRQEKDIYWFDSGKYEEIEDFVLRRLKNGSTGVNR